jgi:glc operon protein GlcG
MKLRLVFSMLAATALFGAPIGEAADQAEQPPNPLDVVPEKMPFNTPYGPPISLQRAQALAQAAVA